MKVIQYASSSRGNFYEIIAGNSKRLLLEIGLTWKNIQKFLSYNMSNIEAAFASHYHADHFKEPEKVTQAGIDVYASKSAFEFKNLLGNRRANIVEDKTLVQLNSFQVLCFGIEHDCPDTLGFVVRENATGEYLLFATDTAFVKQRFLYPFSVIMLECSYDKEILQKRVDTGDINESLAKRLLTSHMEKQNTMKYIAEFCNLSRCQEIHLLHCSGDNIDKAQTKIECEKKFFCKTVII